MLPYDGKVLYQDAFVNQAEADHLFKTLNHALNWQPDEVKIFGKTIITKRKVVWLGEHDYTYSGVLKKAQPWHPALLCLKAKLAEEGMIFNSCLCNYYHDGNESMGYHADDEKELGINPTIASISLGASRLFYFKHRKTKEVIKTPLHHGSLLVMAGETQHHWLHSLPKMMRVKTPRINLTFRLIKDI